MLAFAPSRGAGVREIESLDLCLFLNVPLPSTGSVVGGACRWRRCRCWGGVVVVCPTISNPDATKVAVMLFWIVCLQHPCCVFSSDGDYVSLFLFEFLTASNDFRWASVACPGVRACTLHTCILGRGDVRVCSSSDGVPNGANFPPEFGRKLGGLNVKRRLPERGYGIDVNG